MSVYLTTSQALDVAKYMLAVIKDGGSFEYGDYLDMLDAVNQAQ